MANNDILEEQRKARQNYLELKKMQQGEMAPEPKPSEVALSPKTFKEKRQNFWFHYKWQTIGAIFLTVTIAILTAQCMNREKYDFQMVLVAYKTCLDTQVDSVEEYIEQYAEDINGDGEVNVNIINCTFTEGGDQQYKSTMLTKIQTQIIGNREAVMYIVDQSAHDYMQTIVEGGIFEGEPLALDSEFYEATESKDFGKLPEGLMLVKRRINGTTFAGDEKIEASYKECEKLIEKIKNK